jgi:hypothetical protein
MLGMNRDYAKTSATGPSYFGFDLAYDKQEIKATGASAIGTFAAAAFNGNITGMAWKSAGDDEIRKYDFTYDAANRLKSADFNQHTGGSFNKNALMDFSAVVGVCVVALCSGAPTTDWGENCKLNW